MKYTTFVGDGDSSSFGRVKEALEQKFNAEYIIVKEECVGHVHKRLQFHKRGLLRHTLHLPLFIYSRPFYV